MSCVPIHRAYSGWQGRAVRRRRALKERQWSSSMVGGPWWWSTHQKRGRSDGCFGIGDSVSVCAGHVTAEVWKMRDSPIFFCFDSLRTTVTNQNQRPGMYVFQCHKFWKPASTRNVLRDKKKERKKEGLNLTSKFVGFFPALRFLENPSALLFETSHGVPNR